MSKNEETAIQTLHDKCGKIKEILNTANGLAVGLTGSTPVNEADLKEPAGSLESLVNELVSIEDMAARLLDHLIKIDGMI